MSLGGGRVRGELTTALPERSNSRGSEAHHRPIKYFTAVGAEGEGSLISEPREVDGGTDGKDNASRADLSVALVPRFALEVRTAIMTCGL